MKSCSKVISEDNHNFIYLLIELLTALTQKLLPSMELKQIHKSNKFRFKFNLFDLISCWKLCNFYIMYKFYQIIIISYFFTLHFYFNSWNDKKK